MTRAPITDGKVRIVGIIGLDRGVIVAPGDGDPVLGAFELRLQGQEILVGAELRIGLLQALQRQW